MVRGGGAWDGRLCGGGGVCGGRRGEAVCRGCWVGVGVGGERQVLVRLYAGGDVGGGEAGDCVRGEVDDVGEGGVVGWRVRQGGLVVVGGRGGRGWVSCGSGGGVVWGHDVVWWSLGVAIDIDGGGVCGGVGGLRAAWCLSGGVGAGGRVGGGGGGWGDGVVRVIRRGGVRGDGGGDGGGGGGGVGGGVRGGGCGEYGFCRGRGGDWRAGVGEPNVGDGGGRLVVVGEEVFGFL